MINVFIYIYIYFKLFKIRVKQKMNLCHNDVRFYFNFNVFPNNISSKRLTLIFYIT